MQPTRLITLAESSKSALDAAEAAVTARARKAVRPIYMNDGTDPTHGGTCTFITVDGTDYLVTCAHVIDEANKDTTLFVAEKELVGITATFHLTKPSSGKRKDDLIDFAFTAVGPEWRERGIVPLTEAEMMYPKARFYCAYGYPHSRNGKKTISFTGKNIRPNANPFISIPVDDPKVLDAAGISNEHHLALFRDPDGVKGNKPFEPQGMSGGAIFAMHDLPNVETLAGLKQPRVACAALITHKCKENKLLYGTRMSTIISAILGV